MTAGCKSATKGHFCSLLVSNIFCNPLFPNLPLAFLARRQNTHKTLFLFLEDDSLFSFLCYRCKRRALKLSTPASFGRSSHSFIRHTENGNWICLSSPVPESRSICLRYTAVSALFVCRNLQDSIPARLSLSLPYVLPFRSIRVSAFVENRWLLVHWTVPSFLHL